MLEMGNMEINDILLEEKVRLLSGTPNDFVSIAGIPEKGIVPLKIRYFAGLLKRKVNFTNWSTRPPIPSMEYGLVRSMAH